MAAGRFVAYYRVSTDQQGRSGLGLNAQRAAVAAYLNGGDHQVMAGFTEIETGRKDDQGRPQLAAALAACRLYGAVLLVAKLDRLARNVHFISGLMQSGVQFVAVEMPNATPFMLHIYASVAEEERRAIAARTKAGLASIKAKIATDGAYRSRAGNVITSLGRNNLTDEARAKGAKAGVEAIKAQAFKFAAAVLPRVLALRADGHSLNAIARQLAAEGVKTARGGAWTAVQVSDLLKRVA
jgi:DNA invertase Pin-like site-specific DNA recombinase